MSDIYIPEPPPSACGEVREDGVYLRGVGGGGWGGGENGTQYVFVAIWPPAGDDTGTVTAATSRTVPRVVDMDAVLYYQPEADWLIAQSRSNWLEKNWEKRTVEVFGMSGSERLDNGILEGVTTVRDAQELLQALSYHPRRWQNIGNALVRLSKATVDKEHLHPLVLKAYTHWNQGVPFLVLARMHEVYRRCRKNDKEAKERAKTVIEYMAEEDCYWLQMLEVEID